MVPVVALLSLSPRFSSAVFAEKKSMASDLGKHPDTANHPAINLGFIMMFNGQLSATEEMKKFIEAAFNLRPILTDNSKSV